MHKILIIAILLSPVYTMADDTDAVQQTQDLLRNTPKAQQVLRQSPQGQQVNANITKVVGNGNQDEVYAAAAAMFPDLYKMANGDPEKMQQILTLALQNPEAFANGLSESNKQLIHNIAAKSPANNSANGSAK